MNWLSKTYTTSMVYSGPPQLLEWEVLFIMIRKLTVYTMAPLWNQPLASIEGNYFSLSYQSGSLRQTDPPSTRIKNWQRLLPSHIIQTNH